MADDDLFWPSLYSRLAPSRYRPIEDIDLEEEERAREEEDPETFGLSRFFIGFDTLRAHVETELQTLLNATCAEAAILGAALRGQPASAVSPEEHPFARHPHVRNSIVNFGLPAFIGRNIYALSVSQIEERLRQAVLSFEPRIRPETMRVQVVANRSNRVNPDQPLEFIVEGDILGTQHSIGILISTYWDPEKVRTRVTRVDIER